MHWLKHHFCASFTRSCITTARQCLVLVCLTGCSQNKAEIHPITASSSRSCSDWSLNWQNNACGGWKKSGVSTVIHCVSWGERFHCCFWSSLSSSSSSTPGRLKSSNLKTVSYWTAHSPAAPGLSLTRSTCRWTRRHQPDFWGKKTLWAQTNPRERQTENKVTAETQAVLNITKPPAAHTTQLSTSTWKRWWLFLGPYG